MRISKRVKEFDTLYKGKTNLGNGIVYHHIHPFSDEYKILKKFKIDPLSIYKVDAYVRCENKIIFVETILKKYSNSNYFSVGSYMRINKSSYHMLYVKIIIDGDGIPKNIFDQHLLELINLIRPINFKRLKNKYGLNENYIKII